MKKKPLDTVNWEAFSAEKRLLQMSFLWNNYITLLFISVIDNSYLTVKMENKLSYDSLCPNEEMQRHGFVMYPKSS